MAELTPEEREGILAPLRAQHKFIHAWEIDGHGLIVVRRMRRFELQAFTQKSNAASKKYEATGDATDAMTVSELAVATCCVYPDGADKAERLKALFDEYPEFSGAAAIEISKLGEDGIKSLGKS